MIMHARIGCLRGYDDDDDDDALTERMMHGTLVFIVT